MTDADILHQMPWVDESKTQNFLHSEQLAHIGRRQFKCFTDKIKRDVRDRAVYQVFPRTEPDGDFGLVFVYITLKTPVITCDDFCSFSPKSLLKQSKIVAQLTLSF